MIYRRMCRLWETSPVGADAALRRPYQEELQLTQQQHESLHDLEVAWIRHAMPTMADKRLETRAEQLEFVHVAATLAWSFKPERDRGWRAIVTNEQASR